MSCASISEYTAISWASITGDCDLQYSDKRIGPEKVFIGRVLYNGDLLPGEVFDGTCSVTLMGERHLQRSYELLVIPDVMETVWVKAADGNVPSGAIQGGLTSEQEPLYIGRTDIHGKKIIGKVHPSHKVLYFPGDGKELHRCVYEVLCSKYLPLK